MSIIVDKNKKKSDESHFSGEAVSEAVFDAFDMVEKDNVGKLCLDARLKKGLTQEQASKILKVKVSIIKDFEDGNDFELHGLAYKIGFVRSYAFLLELDADVLVEEFKESLQLNTYKEDYKFLTPNTEAKKFLPMGAVLSLFISVIVYTGWYYSDRNNNVNHVSNQVLESKKTNSSTKNDYIIIEDSLDINKAIEGNLKVLENNGARNIITKNEKFVTPNGAEGIKTFGSLEYPIGNTENFVNGKYASLSFTAENKVMQQIIITWRQDDVYADQIVERILNSVELKPAEE